MRLAPLRCPPGRPRERGETLDVRRAIREMEDLYRVLLAR